MNHNVIEDLINIADCKLRVNAFIKQKSILIWIGEEGIYLKRFSGLQLAVFSKFENNPISQHIYETKEDETNFKSFLSLSLLSYFKDRQIFIVSDLSDNLEREILNSLDYKCQLKDKIIDKIKNFLI